MVSAWDRPFWNVKTLGCSCRFAHVSISISEALCLQSLRPKVLTGSSFGQPPASAREGESAADTRKYDNVEIASSFFFFFFFSS